MLDYIINSTIEYVEQMPKEFRKKYGQFFTSKETAVFMADAFNVPENKETVSILDPGAGSGILSVALIERLQQYSNIRNVELTCYENDPNIQDLLKKNLNWMSEHTNIKVSYKIINDNYILSQKNDYNLSVESDIENKFDMIIGNPPYMKISKDAPEAAAMPDICYGAPNLYFLFAMMSLFNLRENGEMVYIIPRSWTSGAYFKKFRQKFLNYGALEYVHLFTSRDKIFENESVLQETMIIKIKKSLVKPDEIIITTSKSNADFQGKTFFTVPYNTIVNGKDYYVYLVTNEYEVELLKVLNRWKNTLPSIGLKMKTGLTVDFRNKEELRDKEEEGAVPLFYSQHIQNGTIVFPTGEKKEYIFTDKKALLQKNENYLFVKRFTSKEEHRRLQCGIYLAKHYPEYSEISTQNKINFICGLKELSECVVYGLYVLFNSTVYDNYYRILNGSTQVNSTEINSMPIPTLDIIEAMGKELIRADDMSEKSCDKILGRFIYE